MCPTLIKGKGPQSPYPDPCKGLELRQARGWAVGPLLHCIVPDLERMRSGGHLLTRTCNIFGYYCINVVHILGEIF